MHAVFSQCRDDNEETSHILTKAAKSNPFVVISLCAIANVPVKVQYKTSTKNMTNRWRKLIPINDATIFTNTMKYKSSSVPNLLHSCLNNLWAPSPWFVCIWKKNQVFCSLRRPETQFRHKQYSYRERAIKGSLNTILNTAVAVNGVEHQETVNS